MFYTLPLLKRVIDYALSNAKENNNDLVTPSHLFLGMLEEGEGIAIRLMLGMNINLNDIYRELENAKMGNDKLLIYEVGKVLNDRVDMNDKVVGRDKEITDTIEILLRKNKNNPLLIGKAGVGKTAIIEELARRINNNLVPKELQNKKIVMLEMSFLVAGTKYRGEFEERLTKIIEEVIVDKNIILFIDEIHTLVGAGGAEGAIDASNILKPYLARGDIKCIGATTTSEYNKYILSDKALERRFQVININEPTPDETMYILKSIKPSYEKHHNIKIPNSIIKDIVLLSDNNIFNKSNPDKAIDVMDSVCVKVRLKNSDFNDKNAFLKDIERQKYQSLINKDFKKAIKLKNAKIKLLNSENNSSNSNYKISKNDVIEVIKNKTNNYFLDKKDLMNKLKKELNNKLFNQNKIKENIINAFSNYDSNSHKPLSMLFVGGTGVGKTHTAKIISEAISKKENIIRLDMAEYNNEMSITKLVGSSAGYIGYNDEHALYSVKHNPYSIIIIDEIDKAHKKVLNLFLTMLEEGYIKDSKGEIIRFDNAIILMTANNSNNKSVGFINKKDNHQLNNELASRIQNIFYFDDIKEQDVKSYIVNEFKKSKKKYNENKLNELIEKSEYQKYGLRNIKKEINFI